MFHQDSAARAERIRVVVLVLGDLGRSPRMLYHATALADTIAEVDLIGYVETELDAAIAYHPHIRITRLRPVAHRAGRARFIVAGVARVLRQSLELARTLRARASRCDVLLVQNPPAVPTLLVARLATRAPARLVVDWHNFGYTMLALRLGADHPVVRLARGYEHALARRADAHLCVSQAMRDELRLHWGIPDALVLHDRPDGRFTATPAADRSALLARLGETLGLPELTRPTALVVSPSGWGADEDMTLLADAAERYDAFCAEDPQASPDLLLVATGHGPLRASWERRIAALRLRHVHLRTLWLGPQDYPRFVGAADVGVSVHRSSSGLDLPMKIVDLLGAGVPVCALDYGPVLAEVLRHDDNGLLFTSGEQLAQQLRALLRGFPDAPMLARLRANVARVAPERWRDGWTAIARPLFLAGGRR